VPEQEPGSRDQKVIEQFRANGGKVGVYFRSWLIAHPSAASDLNMGVSSGPIVNRRSDRGLLFSGLSDPPQHLTDSPPHRTPSRRCWLFLRRLRA
jgi:hypothetical protein